MTGPSVRVAEASDADAVFGVLTLAFATDPCTRYMLSRPGAFVAGFPRFVRVTGEPAVAAGSAYLADDGAAAAIWLPPGARADGAAIGAVVGEFGLPARLPVLSEVGDGLRAYHPETPHWYLSFVGVDPMRQGRGLGSALLEAGLARCDADGADAYLESSNPKNTPLYERYGFEVMGVIQPADFPPLVPMLRPARR
ncbi:MAG TPA: GNAT family N-acetyltransferase [Caulobacteraceae bacterium]|nr:GNAT family N-acetyltransferase [Caulobacteraceae bacterium]